MKALARLQSKPKDCSWDEFVTIMRMFGYDLKKSSGSSRRFIHPDTKVLLFMHEPHPTKVLKAYQVRDALDFLKEQKHI